MANFQREKGRGELDCVTSQLDHQNLPRTTVFDQNTWFSA